MVIEKVRGDADFRFAGSSMCTNQEPYRLLVHLHPMIPYMGSAAPSRDSLQVTDSIHCVQKMSVEQPRVGDACASWHLFVSMSCLRAHPLPCHESFGEHAKISRRMSPALAAPYPSQDICESMLTT